MKRNIKRNAIVLLACMFLLGGCGALDPYPEMTDEQYSVVVHYAAGLLMRYRKGTSDKLTYLDAEYTPEHLMAEAMSSYAPEVAPPAEETTPPEPVSPVPADNETDRAEGDENPEAQTGPETELPEESPDDAPETDTAPAVSYNYTDIDASGLQSLAGNVRVEYTGYSVRNVYPDTQAQGAVAAAPGDKLLVVDFSVQNLADVPVTFNTAEQYPQFKFVINNDVQGFTMVTMIANDLSGMDCEIAPGARTDAVLLMEVPESLAKRVDTLDLIIKIRGGEEQTVKLE